MAIRSLKIQRQMTSKKEDAVQKYLTDIKNIELITPEEEARLAKKIRSGDKEALDKLTKANLRFVFSVAKQYEENGLSLPDLVNEGNIGLITAAERFDETKGFKFISYAVWWIRQAIISALAEHARLVRLPSNKISLSKKIEKAGDSFEQKNEREPSAEELAEELEMETDAVEQMLQTNIRHVSIDEPSIEGEDICMSDLLRGDENPDKDILTESLKREVKASLSQLTRRQAEVVNYFFGLDGGFPLSLKDISLKYGIGEERIRQVKDKAISILRRHKNLLQYLG